MKTILKIYKSLASPFLVYLFGKGCRHYPTCSEYTVEAINKHGIFMGLFLGVKRIIRCNPFSRSDFYDPVG